MQDIRLLKASPEMPVYGYRWRNEREGKTADPSATLPRIS
jgi:hypothetical protein